MKILLCSQYHGTCRPIAVPQIAFPLGLAYIASMLDEHEIRIFDCNLMNNPLDELRRTIEDFNPDIVAVSLRNIDGQLSFDVCSYYDPFVSMIRLIKETMPSCKIIVGGTGFTVFPKEIMERNPEIDFGVVSNGELAIIDLLSNLENPEKVKNLVFRNGEKICYNGLGASPELDSLPFPFWKGFDMSKYKQFPYSMGIESKRGCAFNCIHCLYPCLQGCHVLLKSPKKVVDEIEKLVNDYGINHFFFVDPIFNFPPDHGKKICQELLKRNVNIKWRAWFRSDFMNSKIMTDALKAGCDIFDFSPDGASNEAMKVLGKNMNFNQVERTLNLISKTENAKVGYNFMYDIPRANFQHLFGLTRFIPKIIRKCGNKLQYISLSRLRIYPNTPLYETALKDGVITKQTDLIPPVYYKSKSSNLQRYPIAFLGKIIWKNTCHTDS